MQIHQSVQWDIFPINFPDLVLVSHLLLETIWAGHVNFSLLSSVSFALHSLMGDCWLLLAVL